MTAKSVGQATQRPFAVFDIDGTLIRWQLYHAIADALAHLGYFNSSEFESIRRARMQWKKRTHHESFKEYESKLVESYDRILSELTVSQFDQAASAVFDEYKDQVYTYTRDLIKELKNNNYLIFAISGSQKEIVARVASYYGFDDFVGSHYEQRNSRFTGNKVIAKGQKHLILQKLVKKHGATYRGSLAVGDSEGDITMLEAVERPIVFNPSRNLFNQAKQRGWEIVIERKNMVYKLEQRNGSYILAQTN